MGDLHSVTRWKERQAGDVTKEFGLGPIFKKLGIGRNAEELFGEEPPAFTHAGDVSLARSTLVDGGLGLFVIDGSLTVDGTFTLTAVDAYTVLVVRGDLKAANLQQFRDTQLVVFGAVVVDGLLHVDLTDAGFTVFKGPVTAHDIFRRDHGVQSAKEIFAQRPKGRVLETDDPDVLTPEFTAITEGRGDDVSKFHAALAKGVTLFRPPAQMKATHPRLSAAKIKELTVDQFLEVVNGFTEAQLDGPRVNPNYLRKGTSGQPLESLVLMGTATATAFPANLANLKSLKLLQPNDAAATERLLKSVSVLRGLRSLCLVSTALTTLPAGVAELSDLEHLELRDNAKLVELPSWVGGLRRLRTLHLSGNALATLPPELAQLTQLREVRIEEARLKWPAALSALRKIAKK